MSGATLRRSQRWLLGAAVLLATADAGLALWAVHWTWFSSSGFAEYFAIVVDFITHWTGRLVWIAGAIWGVRRIVRGRPAESQPSKEQAYSSIVAFLFAHALRRGVLPTAVALLGAAAVGISILLFQEQAYIPPSGQLLATPYVRPLWPPFTPKSNPKKLYLADYAGGRVVVFDVDHLDKPVDEIRLGNPRSPIKPSHVALAPSRAQLLISAPDSNQLFIRDLGPGNRTIALEVGNGPTAIAITPDERKAYVSNELPLYQGTISVVDLGKQQVTKTIPGVNCPEGMAIAPDGRFLYVASQCGGNQDPLFVIDTRSDTKAKSIAGLAVGSNVLVSRNGAKAYVKRSQYDRRDPASGTIVHVPDQLSVVDTRSGTVVKTIQCPAGLGPMALTADGRYLLFGSEQRLVFLDVAGDAVFHTVGLGTSPASIATTEDGAVFVWMPGPPPRLFLQGLSGIRKDMAQADLLGCGNASGKM